MPSQFQLHYNKTISQSMKTICKHSGRFTEFFIPPKRTPAFLNDPTNDTHANGSLFCSHNTAISLYRLNFRRVLVFTLSFNINNLIKAGPYGAPLMRQALEFCQNSTNLKGSGIRKRKLSLYVSSNFIGFHIYNTCRR